MNKKLLCDALSMLDAGYIEENIIHSPDVLPSSGKEFEMNRNPSGKSTKRLIVLAIAACLVLSTFITASASNLWGIRDLFEKSGRNLPEEAYEYIVEQDTSMQTQDTSVQAEEWSCAVTETLCDPNEVTVVIRVVCSDSYVLIPTDCGFNDPTGFIGVESDMTLGEYAASQNKNLMKINANFPENGFDIGGVMVQFERVSDGEMMVLLQGEIKGEISSEQGICTVTVNAPSVRKTKQELTFTVSEAPITSETVYVPINPNALHGVCIGEATVTETPLGISIRIEGTADEWDDIFSLDLWCEQISGFTGGYEKGENGAWTLKWSQGQGELTDRIIIHVNDLETGAFIEDIVFIKK